MQNLGAVFGSGNVSDVDDLYYNAPGRNIDWSKIKWTMLQDLGAVLLGSGNVPDVDDLYYNAPGGDIDWSHY